MPSPVPEVPDERPPLSSIERSILEGEVREALREVYDPELPVNVYDLGLIYEIRIADDRTCHILMTLTSPACPVAGTLPGEVQGAARQVPGLREVTVELTWDPPYTMERMPEEVRLQLGF